MAWRGRVSGQPAGSDAPTLLGGRSAGQPQTHVGSVQQRQPVLEGGAGSGEAGARPHNAPGDRRSIGASRSLLWATRAARSDWRDRLLLAKPPRCRASMRLPFPAARWHQPQPHPRCRTPPAAPTGAPKAMQAALALPAAAPARLRPALPSRKAVKARSNRPLREFREDTGEVSASGGESGGAASGSGAPQEKQQGQPKYIYADEQPVSRATKVAGCAVLGFGGVAATDVGLLPPARPSPACRRASDACSLHLRTALQSLLLLAAAPHAPCAYMFLEENAWFILSFHPAAPSRHDEQGDEGAAPPRRAAAHAARSSCGALLASLPCLASLPTFRLSQPSAEPPCCPRSLWAGAAAPRVLRLWRRPQPENGQQLLCECGMHCSMHQTMRYCPTWRLSGTRAQGCRACRSVTCA